jgi:hypothetical protein
MILFVTNDFIFEDQNTQFNMSTSFLFLCDFFNLRRFFCTTFYSFGTVVIVVNLRETNCNIIILL